MPIVAAAVPALIGATVAGGAALLAADQQKGAIKDATAAQTAANDKALQLQKEQYDQQRADYAPWRAVGVSALQMLSRTMGVQLPADVFTNSISDVSGYTPPATATGGTPAPAGTAAPPTTTTTPGKSAGQQYFEANPDVKAEYDRILPNVDWNSPWARQHGFVQGDPDAFAQYHYQTNGQGEGRAWPTAIAPTTTPTAPTPTAPAPTTPTTPQQPAQNVAGQNLDPNGLPTGATTSRYGDFYASPDYQFRLDEGTRAITGNRAAKGLLDSGALGKGLINYGQQAASQEFGNWFNRIATLAGYGQSAVNGTTAAGQAAANNQTGIIQNQGDNLASSIATRGGITSGMINGVGSAVGGLIGNLGGGSGGITPAANPATIYNPQAQTPFNPQGLIPTNVGAGLYGSVV